MQCQGPCVFSFPISLVIIMVYVYFTLHYLTLPYLSLPCHILYHLILSYLRHHHQQLLHQHHHHYHHQHLCVLLCFYNKYTKFNMLWLVWILCHLVDTSNLNMLRIRRRSEISILLLFPDLSISLKIILYRIFTCIFRSLRRKYQDAYEFNRKAITGT